MHTRPLRALRRDPLGFLSRVAREQGDVARFAVGREQVVLLRDPKLVREVLVVRHRDFVKQNVLRTRPLRLDPDRGLMMNDDPALHVRGRRIFQPAFSAERLRAYAIVVADHARRLADRWRDGQTIDLPGDLRPISLAILAEGVFELELGSEAALLERRLAELLAPFSLATSPVHEVLALLRPRPLVRSLRAQTELIGRMHELVRSRRGGGGRDVVSLAAHALDEPDGPTENQAAMDCLGILLAGVDTTATAVTWALIEAARRGGEAERLRDEALAADGDPERLPASRAFFAEALRLYPPSWYIGRRARVDTGAGPVDLPAGTVALASPYLIHRDERLHAEPDRFHSGRWLRGEGEDRRGLAYLPFGAGPRQCLGERLAWLEGTLLLSAIARRWRLEPLDPGPPRLSAKSTLAPFTRARLVARAW